ncbi:hypothetical protein SLEP1_g26888 [Rubroshorea leprosula]|uniref:ribonuclease Z n=1 Tax=Rubroshorea leprosula TaxID=152421 RepID=A0AAV5JUN0_9ROSI|nr:hypothetical protein SLEP1_g26888 [Rubroshorea leprosula]
MPCVFSPNLRLLFSPLRPSLASPLFISKPKPKPYSLFTTVLSSSSPGRKQPAPYRDSLNLTRRNSSTFRENKDRGKEAVMDETESSSSSSFGFNKRRAEGKDKNDRPKKNLQLKSRTLNPTNTIAYVQILGTGMDTQDTSPSVLLFFDKQRFVFNAGEGLQRFCTEHKIKLSKIDHIFLSRVCSETAGGLPGLLLTLAGMGEEGMSVNVWGPSDLTYLVDAMKSFIPHAAMVHTQSFGPAHSAAALPDPSKLTEPYVLVNDEVVKISAVFLCPSRSEGLPVRPGEMSVIYICELPELMGKFDPKKAVALGLKPGPKYGELQKGKSVKSDSLDIMVHPSDVMGPPIPGPIFILVDCPTESHVEELLSIESLTEYYTDLSGNQTKSAKTVNCVIHLSPASVVHNHNYQKWMKKFGQVQHIVAGHEIKNVEVPILKSSARIAAQLNYVCPQFFPAPGFWSVNQLNSLTQDANAASEVPTSELCESISAENLLKFTLRPYAQLGLDRSHIPSLMTHSEIINELLSEVPEIVDAAQLVRKFWHEPKETKELNPVQDNKHVIEEPWLDENTLPSCLENIRRDDLEIVLLGTGSSQPSKYRNVSSVHINLFSKGSLLLDCGEGTLGQLKRRYGIDGANDAVRNLKCVWISHIHADHHTGLARVLALRRDLLKGVPHEPLLVIGPWQLKRFLDAYQRLEDLDMQFLDCGSTMEVSWNAFEHDFESNKDQSASGNPPNSHINNNERSKNNNGSLFSRGSPMKSLWKRPGSPVGNSAAYPILESLKTVLVEAGLEALISFPVVHCPQAFGVALKAAERVNSVGKVIPGWKIVYSGDTRPCPELIEASRGATVLIHEATFEDGLVEEAIAKNHSTTKEAIEMGNSAGAYRIILTHFSQRYPKIPVFDDTHMHKTCIAFDMMNINIADLPVLPKVLPYLRLLFRDEMAVDESEDVLLTVSEALAS